MCQILFCHGRKPTNDELISAYVANNDGIGIAWYDKKYHYYQKGITFQELKKIINKINLPFVIHFRYATSGSKTADLCHPFLITKNLDNPSEYVGLEPLLFHNGIDNIVFNYKNFLEQIGVLKLPDNMSDTYYIAKILGLSKNILETIELFNGKFILIKDKKIFRIGNFTDKNGIYFSNPYNYHFIKKQFLF